MTSLAFIMGVVPLVLASGRGAEMRHAMGVAVFAGMLGRHAVRLVLHAPVLCRDSQVGWQSPAGCSTSTHFHGDLSTMHKLVSSLLGAVLTGCAVGPNYQRPDHPDAGHVWPGDHQSVCTRRA
jgi:hypothetical protein